MQMNVLCTKQVLHVESRDDHGQPVAGGDSQRCRRWDGSRYMGGGTIEAGGDISPHMAKVGGQRGSKYIVDILYACNKKYILHVYSIIMSL